MLCSLLILLLSTGFIECDAQHTFPLAEKDEGTRWYDDDNESNGLHRASEETVVERRYIVVFADGVDEDEREATMIQHLQNGMNRNGRKLRNAITAESLYVEDDDEQSLSARRLNRETKLQQLINDQRVRFIEEEQVVTKSENQNFPPSYGLDRIDQVSGMDRNYHYDYTGAGVTAYVLDTGIRTSHDDFGGRVSCGFNAHEDTEDCDDMDGHGTHVAATLGGKDYGVAKGVDIVTVKVLGANGEGTTWDVLAGVDYVAGEAENRRGERIVANLSLGGSISLSMNLATAAATANGVVFVVAAGNSDASACRTSPANVDSVITVGSTNAKDRRSFFSNYGICVDIFAPGEDITSAWVGSDSDWETTSGTSMASPHVAGVAALYMEAYPGATPEQIKDLILNDATPNVVKDTNNSPNLLVCTAQLATTTAQPPGEDEEPPERPPQASDAYSRTSTSFLKFELPLALVFLQLVAVSI